MNKCRLLIKKIKIVGKLEEFSLHLIILRST